MLNIYALDQGKFYGACSISKGMYLCMAYWSSQARYIGNGNRTNNWVMDALISDINVPNTAALCKRGCLLYYLFIYLFFFFCYGCCNISTFFFSQFPCTLWLKYQKENDYQKVWCSYFICYKDLLLLLLLLLFIKLQWEVTFLSKV